MNDVAVVLLMLPVCAVLMYVSEKAKEKECEEMYWKPLRKLLAKNARHTMREDQGPLAEFECIGCEHVRWIAGYTRTKWWPTCPKCKNPMTPTGRARA